MTLCRQCWNADAIIDMLVCVRCYDRNNPTDAIEEGKDVRRGEDLKAREEEPWADQEEVGGAEMGRNQGGAP